MTGKYLIISAPSSGSGKTLLTAGLCIALQRQNVKLTVFKTGPDYLDPMFIRQSTGIEVRHLDHWMMSEEEIASELFKAGESSDLVLIEGVMGLHDGEFSTARLAKTYDIPVAIVINASSMAQTFGALVFGLANFDPDVRVVAAIANRVGSRRHGQMLEESVQNPVSYLGWIERDEQLTVPERHLGIHARSQESSSAVAQVMSDKVEGWIDSLMELASPSIRRPSLHLQMKGGKSGALAGKVIAVAKDDAFSFLYPANVDFLMGCGAEIVYFSPVADDPLPSCDALYLPGGYPETYADNLAAAHQSAVGIRGHIDAGKPCVAECGGMLYLLGSLGWGEKNWSMLGLLPGAALVGERLSNIGYQGLPESPLRGHTFHYASVKEDNPDSYAVTSRGAEGEPIYRYKKTIASFVHWYFPSDPEQIITWFSA